MGGGASRPTGVRTLSQFPLGLTSSPPAHRTRGDSAEPSPATRHPQFYKADYMPHDATGPSYSKLCPGTRVPPPLSPRIPASLADRSG